MTRKQKKVKMGKEGKNRGRSAGASTPGNALGVSSKAKGASASGGTRQGGTLVAANKSFGQNFLKNPMVVQSIVEKAEIRSTDVVFEIGPGTGNLTVELLKRAKKVICVEFDRRMVRLIIFFLLYAQVTRIATTRSLHI